MGNIVAHIRKVKTSAGLGAVVKHNSRMGCYLEDGTPKPDLPDWMRNLDLSKYNSGDIGVSPQAVFKRRADRMKSVQFKRKPQKNASTALEFVFSGSEGALNTPEEWEKYLKDCKNFVAKEYGAENIIHSVIHFEEKVPHLHMLVLPIFQIDKDFHKYSSSQFLRGRAGLREFQTQIHKQVGAKYGLKRGVEGSTARHTSTAEWMASVKKREKELEKNEKSFNEIDAFSEKVTNMKSAQRFIPDGLEMPDLSKLADKKLTESAVDYKNRVAKAVFDGCEKQYQKARGVYSSKMIELSHLKNWIYKVRNKASENQEIVKNNVNTVSKGKTIK